VNYAAASLLIHGAGMGHQALALSTSAVALFSFLAQLAILRVRIGGVHGRALLAQLVKMAIACVAMAGATAVSTRGMQAWLGVSQLARLADLALSIPFGVAVYYAACRVLGVSGLDAALQAFTAPLRVRLSPGKKAGTG
jgi:hypothetical protein